MSIAAQDNVGNKAKPSFTVQEGKDQSKTQDAHDINVIDIESMKQAAEKKAPIDHYARDHLIQLIAHKDEKIREKARASVLELYKLFPNDIGQRLVTLLKIAQNDKKRYLTQDAKLFLSYHVAKHEADCKRNGQVYQQALATWKAVLKDVPDEALLWSVDENSELVENHFGSDASLEKVAKVKSGYINALTSQAQDDFRAKHMAAALDAAGKASFEYKTNVVREGLSGDALLKNDRYISLSELESYARHLEQKQNLADTPLNVRYHGVTRNDGVDDLKNLIATNNEEVAIGTVLVRDHYVHIVRRDTDLGKEICVLNTLGSFEERRKESQDKFAELKNDLTNQGFTFSEVNVNLQHSEFKHDRGHLYERGLPNAEGVGLPNACGIFGIALQDWSQDNSKVPKGSLEELVNGFVEHVKEMPQEQRQSMNDVIRFRLLNAAANCQSSDINNFT